jgi:hypothetical protein
MLLFKKNKREKAKYLLGNDIKFIVPSARAFFTQYKDNIHKFSSKLDAAKVLDVDEATRYQHLIDNFNEIALEALVETLIEVGYKKEEKKKWLI